MNSKRTLFLIEAAILTALALVLDMVPFLSFKIWAQGGSISFSMIPIFIIAFRWGLKGGLLSGLLFGILQGLLGGYIIHPIQGLLDYPIAFLVLGFAGLFAKQLHRKLNEGDTAGFIKTIISGVLLGSALRFVAHFLAGIVFFDSMIDGMNIWLYSLLYNVSYLIPCFVINSIAVTFLFNNRPRLVAAAK